MYGAFDNINKKNFQIEIGFQNTIKLNNNQCRNVAE